MGGKVDKSESLTKARAAKKAKAEEEQKGTLVEEEDIPRAPEEKDPLSVYVTEKNITIAYGGHRVYVPIDRFGDVLERMDEGRRVQIEKLQGEIGKLQSLGRETSTTPGTLFDGMEPTTVSDEQPEEKPVRLGFCRSCDKSLSGDSQPCAVCKNMCHKGKCLDSGVCKACLEMA